MSSFYNHIVLLLLLSMLQLGVIAQQKFADSVASSCEKLDHDTLIYQCLYNENVIALFGSGKYEEAIDLLETVKSKKYIQNYPAHALSVASGLGTLNYVLADNESAIKYYSECINLCNDFEEIGHQKPNIISKMAVVFGELGQIEKAKSLYKEVINEYLLTLDSLEIDYTHYFNLGAEYLNQDSVKQSIPLFKIATKISENNKDTAAIINCVTALSSVLSRQKKYDEAKTYADKSLFLSLVKGDSLGYANSLLAIGEILEFQQKFNEAKSYNEEARLIFLKFGKISRYIEITKSNADSYNERGFYKDAAELYEEYILFVDSLKNDDANKQLADFQAKYETEKKESEIKILKEQDKVREANENRLNLALIVGAVGLIITLGLLIYVYTRLKVTRRQKELIVKQKKEVDLQRELVADKNRQILDSINYAKRIQKAIRPSEEQIKSHFDDAFVFFKPKDIVSGDFYWLREHNDLLYFTVADCTGHGVPGAFMSLIGSSLLDKSVLQLNIKEPNEILKQVNSDLHKRLSVSNQEKIKDGMDLVLCAIDLKNLQLYSSGAFNIMYVLRDDQLHEIKGDKLQLGNLEQTKNKEFSVHQYELQKGDTLYLFSDGFPDQKGGPKNKKFYYPVFRKLLKENSHLSMIQQKQKLKDTFDKWKGDNKQIDDICVVGLKI